MSSNIPLIKPTEDQIQDGIDNLKTDKQKASYSYFEKPLSEDKEKDMDLNKLTSLDKSRSSYNTETEYTVKQYTKTRSMSSASSDDKNTKEQKSTVITIKTKKLTRDNQSLSSAYVLGASITTVSPDGDCIPRKKEKKENFRNFNHSE